MTDYVNTVVLLKRRCTILCLAQKFDTLWNQLLAVCRKEIDQFDTLREERKFCKIMEMKTVALANALGQYLVQANDAKLKGAASSSLIIV